MGQSFSTWVPPNILTFLRLQLKVIKNDVIEKIVPTTLRGIKQFN
jgi:hypothetical protein